MRDTTQIPLKVIFHIALIVKDLMLMQVRLGKIHVQHRSSDGCRLLFVRICEEELDLDFQWHCQGVSCFPSENLIMGERRFIVECSNSNFFGIFNRLIAEIVSDCILSGLKILELFRFEKSFYSAIPNALTDEQAVGLFGELYLMRHWFSNSIPLIIRNDYWNGPSGASKDYNFSEFQIEVKNLNVRYITNET